MIPPPVVGETGSVLVVDDIEANRDLLTRRVRRLGHEVDEASDGTAALAQLAERPFDVVLLDVMMPGLNGYDVLERIKSDPATRATRVIMVSAVDEIESVVRCLELGADDYLMKPFNAVVLEARRASSLARKQLEDRRAAHTRSLERELEIGRQIQQGFLPTEIPAPSGWAIAPHLASARQVSGDFYDAFMLPGGELGVVVGDVCDKGVGAALFMALFRSLLRSNAEACSTAASAADVLTTSVTATNRYVATTHSTDNMFATIAFVAIDCDTGDVTYLNCGHESLVLRRSDGQLEDLAPTGPAVGLIDNAEFTTASTTMAPNELLILYTDGVTEARNASGEFFGEQRLQAALTNASSAIGSIEAIVGDVASFVADAEIADDLTIVAISRS